jgi:hypothetical protein
LSVSSDPPGQPAATNTRQAIPRNPDRGQARRISAAPSRHWQALAKRIHRPAQIFLKRNVCAAL